MTRPQAPGLPARLFHWLFALGVVAAATVSLVLGREHRLFPTHSTIGLALAGLVVLRILWAVVGASRNGRGAECPRRAGRNPVSAVVSIGMLALVLGLAATGLVMTRGHADVGRAHALLAYALVAMTGVHIVGVAAKRLSNQGPSREA